MCATFIDSICIFQIQKATLLLFVTNRLNHMSRYHIIYAVHLEPQQIVKPGQYNNHPIIIH